MIAGADLLERFLKRLPGKCILVVGDLILDEYVFGEVKRISPEAPVPIVEFRKRTHVPGGAANVAANIAALGCDAIAIGVVGTDAEAGNLRAVLENAGVRSDHLLADAQRPTTVKLRILGHHQQIVRLDREDHTPISSSLENVLLKRIAECLTVASVCILSDYGKGVVTGRLASQTISRCQAAGVPVLVDPKSLGLDWCCGATLVKPNKQEAERLAAREINDELSFLEAGQHLADSLRGTDVLITRGALGMSLFHHQREPYHIATAVRNVFDVIGAGDTVISMYGMALAAETTAEEAVWLASQAAAIAVEKLGTATVSAAELRARCHCL